MIQSAVSTASMALSSGAQSSGAAIRIIGAMIGSAPSAARRSDKSGASSRGRVTAIRLPNSGRSSNQRRCCRSAATLPTTRIAGRLGRDAFVSSASCSSVPSTVCWPGSVPS